MVSANLEELELLADWMVRAAVQSDETLGRLRFLLTEMQEDAELLMYEQSTFAMESMTLAIDALNRSNDTLQSLKTVLAPIVSMYQEHEQANRNALSRMTVSIGSLNSGYASALEPTTVPCEEQTEEATVQAEVEQLVAQSAFEMQIANIAAIAETVEDEYAVDQVQEA